jgi:hypothetical protein
MHSSSLMGSSGRGPLCLLIAVLKGWVTSGTSVLEQAQLPAPGPRAVFGIAVKIRMDRLVARVDCANVMKCMWVFPGHGIASLSSAPLLTPSKRGCPI